MKPGNKVFTITSNKQIGVVKAIHDKVIIFETFDGETRLLNPEYHYVTNGDEEKYIPWWIKLLNKFKRK